MRATSPPSPRLGYEPRLDGLRAVAVTLVIVSHVLRGANGAGPVGVGMFFVLSGFLITAILDGERASTGKINLRNFYARRALRLYPALVLFTAAFVIGLFLHLWRTPLGRGLGSAAMALTYTTDAFTLIAKGRWTAFETLPTWSLSVEEQFYVLWPLAFLLLLRVTPNWRMRWLLLGGGVTFATATRAISSRYAAVALSPLTWTDALLIGCGLALAYRNGWVRPRRVHPALLAIATLPALRICLYGLRPGFDQIIGLTLFDIGVAVWIVHCLGRPGRIDILGAKPIVRLGRLSYGMYLWHTLIAERLTNSYQGGNLLRLCIIYALTVAVADASFRFVETPFLRRKQRFSSGAGAETQDV